MQVWTTSLHVYCHGSQPPAHPATPFSGRVTWSLEVPVFRADSGELLAERFAAAGTQG